MPHHTSNRRQVSKANVFTFITFFNHLTHGGCSAKIPFQQSFTIYKGNTLHITVPGLSLLPALTSPSFHLILCFSCLYFTKFFFAFPACYFVQWWTFSKGKTMKATKTFTFFRSNESQSLLWPQRKIPFPTHPMLTAFSPFTI